MIEKLHLFVFSEEFKKKVEKVFVTLSIVSFILHLTLILINKVGIIDFPDNKLLTNPIVAIYTPFSFILVYEVFLVVYYLPRSISQYIRKQYEIITLIIVRRIFKVGINVFFKRIRVLVWLYQSYWSLNWSVTTAIWSICIIVSDVSFIIFYFWFKI